MNRILAFFLAAATAMLLSASTASAQGPADSVKTAVIRVGNLHCNGDMPAIKKRLLNQDGIDEVTFTERNGEASTFTVIYHTAATSEMAIEKAIETTPGCDDPAETPYRVQRGKTPKKKKS